jgi:hypothetical protein
MSTHLNYVVHLEEWLRSMKVHCRQRRKVAGPEFLQITCLLTQPRMLSIMFEVTLQAGP